VLGRAIIIYGLGHFFTLEIDQTFVENRAEWTESSWLAKITGNVTLDARIDRTVQPMEPKTFQSGRRGDYSPPS
jgi:hypothetical protein